MPVEIKISYEDSDVGRGNLVALAFNEIINSLDKLQKANAQMINVQLISDIMKSSLEGSADTGAKDCVKESGYSESKCKDLLNNVAWEVCESKLFKKMFPIDCDLEYRSSFNASAWWFGGICGLLTGVFVAIGVWMAVYCVFLKKSKKSHGGANQISPKVIN